MDFEARIDMIRHVIIVIIILITLTIMITNICIEDLHMCQAVYTMCFCNFPLHLMLVEKL